MRVSAPIPIALKTDREAFEAALNTIGAIDPREARVVHIKNSLEIAELDISEALLEEIKGKKELELMGELGVMSFESEGSLRPVFLSHP